MLHAISVLCILVGTKFTTTKTKETMTTQTNKVEAKNPQLFYNVKVARIQKMYKLLDKIRLAQLGSDKQSRVEYRYMEKQLLIEIEKEIELAVNMTKKYDIIHSPKDFFKNA